MKTYCKNCKLVTETLDGYYYQKCAKCYHAVRKPYATLVISIVALMVMTFLLFNVSATTVTVNQTEIGVIRSDFYGVANGNAMSEWKNISEGMNCVLNKTSNYTRERQAILDMGVKTLRMDMILGYDSMNYTTLVPNLTGTNKLDAISNIKWGYENNISFLLIMKDMPTALANTTTGDGICDSDKHTCPPINYTQYCFIVRNYLNNVTEGGKYNSTISGIEVWNEPDLNTFWLKNLSASDTNTSIRSTYYNEMYSNMYSCVKSYYPWLAVGGPVTASMDVNQGRIIFNNFLANFSNQMDFVDIHKYHYNVDAITDITDTLDYVQTQCNTYNANCSRMILSEWNFINKSDMFGSKQGAFIGTSLSGILNKYPAITNEYLFKLSSEYQNQSCSSSYNYSLYNQYSDTKYIGYNTSQTFATNHKAGNTVITSSSSDSGIKVVASKDTVKDYITLINTKATSDTVTLTMSGISGDILTDVNNPYNWYPIINNQATITLASNDVLTLKNHQMLTEVNTPSGQTSSPTVNIQYNISMPDNQQLRNLTFNWGTSSTNFMDGLVLWYNFDNRSSLGENDTKVVDLSGNGNNGTVIGGSNISWTQNGKYGGAFNYSGNVNYITITENNNLLNNTNSFSINFWVKVRNYTFGATQRLINKGDLNAGTPALGWECYVVSTGIQCEINNMTGSTNKVTKGFSTSSLDWQLISWNYNGSSVSLYQNAILEQSGNVAFNNFINNNNIRIGIRNNALTSPFNGSIDDVMIFNRSLSSNEISELYKSQLTKYDSQNYSFQTNQTNTGNPTPYNLCSSNSTTSICSDVNSISRISTLTTNFGTSIGNIRSDFYGVTSLTNIHDYGAVSNDMDCVRDDSSNQGLIKSKIIDLNSKTIRLDAVLSVSPSEDTLDTTYQSGNYKTMQWIVQNNKKALWVLIDMPDWLANKTANCSNNNATCPPTNYTKYANLVNIWLNNISNNGQWDDNIEILVWNEPATDSFMINLADDHPLKFEAYKQLYNVTYDIIKLNHPTVSIGGVSDNYNGTPYFVGNFYGNFSNKLDFVDIHTHLPNTNSFNYLNNRITEILNICNLNNINCSRIINSEYAMSSSATLSHTSYGGAVTSSGFADTLNIIPANASILSFNLDTKYANNSCDLAVYRQSLWDEFSNIDQIEYNVTKSFATKYAKAGSTVYTSTSDDDDIKVVTTKDGNNYNVIVINTVADAKNISLSGLPTAIESLDDSLGNRYQIDSSGNLQLGLVEGYGVTYLGDEVVRGSLVLGAPCNQGTLGMYGFILDMAAMAIIAFLMYYVFKDGIYEMNMQKLILLFIGIIIGIIMFQMSADNLAIGTC